MENNIHIDNQGLIDYGIYGQKMASDYSWITFGRDEKNNLFIVYMIGTSPDHQNKGHATRLLDIFFGMVKKMNGLVKIESYTAAGEIYIRHVIETLALQHGVRIIK